MSETVAMTRSRWLRVLVPAIVALAAAWLLIGSGFVAEHESAGATRADRAGGRELEAPSIAAADEGNAIRSDESAVTERSEAAAIGGPGELVVTVIGQFGQRMAGAVVAIEGPIYQVAAAGDDGVARFPNLPEAEFEVSARGRDESEASPELARIVAAAPTPFTLRMLEKARIRGRVVDGGGAPLANARVIALDAPSKIDAVTAVDGTFELCTPRGWPVNLCVDGMFVSLETADVEWSPYRGTVRVQAPSDGVWLVATPVPLDRKVDVLVTLPDGRPAPLARVLHSSTTCSRERLGITDTDGRVLLEGLADEPLRIHALPPLGRDDHLVPSTELHLRTDGSSIVLPLRAGAVLAIRVLDADGNPVARAHVELKATDGSESLGAVTDSEGRCSVDVPERSKWDVSVPRRDGVARTIRTTGSYAGATPGKEIEVRISEPR